MKTDSLKRQAEALIPTPWGNFRMIAYAEDAADWMPHLALVHEDYQPGLPVFVRLHSECITGDLFRSRRCDCGEQLERALTTIAQQKGILLYLRQEGRGIGIINKLKAYQLQDQGLNTIDANLHLGLEVDARQYDLALAILHDLEVSEVHLLTNNPEKVQAFEHGPIKILSRIPLVVPPQDQNAEYLKTKQLDMGHLFDLF
ncbi:MAG: GTP cyclohydrolase II [Bacteroidetes bacterium]|nr:MAG: GTP cyclohydrolase II [Bacteroidota bacterium]